MPHRRALETRYPRFRAARLALVPCQGGCGSRLRGGVRHGYRVCAACDRRASALAGDPFTLGWQRRYWAALAADSEGVAP